MACLVVLGANMTVIICPRCFLCSSLGFMSEMGLGMVEEGCPVTAEWTPLSLYLEKGQHFSPTNLPADLTQ